MLIKDLMLPNSLCYTKQSTSSINNGNSGAKRNSSVVKNLLSMCGFNPKCQINRKTDDTFYGIFEKTERSSLCFLWNHKAP